MVLENLQQIIGFLLLGGLNGVLIESLAGMAASGGTGYNLLIYSVMGIFSIIAVSVIARLFTQIFGKLWAPSQIVTDVGSGKVWGTYAGAVLVGGAVNGMVYYGISGLSVFTAAGYLGAWIAGGLALIFYMVLAQFIAGIRG